MTSWKIGFSKGADTLRFAAKELQRCAAAMDERTYPALLEGEGGSLRLRVRPEAFQVSDTALDDAYRIDVRDGAGSIEGSNERSVLLGVYRLLRELGCQWLRPGAEGERIPQKDLSAFSVTIDEAASYRHRGVCIEGNCAYEHVRDMVEWLPRIGMNSYFIQFMKPFTFFDRWYSHNYNPTIEPEPVSMDEVLSMKESIEREIKLRGLLYHAVGHGWTCEPFGIEGSSWSLWEQPVPEEVRGLLAEVNGKRELWRKTPLNTNLCYSNPAALDRMSTAVADYCGQNPRVDYLHLWLADDSNNQCECEHCRETRPSDFYVRLLNEVDRKLTERGLSTHVVFLVYVDLLWAPEHETLNHPERFTLMFAPITRTYTTPFCSGLSGELPKTTPYVRNKLKMPREVSMNIAHLREWQSNFQGDGFDFDYHLMWDHCYDFGNLGAARVLYEDMCNLDRLGLNGMMSCQVQRCFFPTGIMMWAMASALWNKSRPFDEVADEYFSLCYGRDAERVKQYLLRLTELCDTSYQRNEKPAVCEESAERFAQIPAVIHEMLPVIDERLRTSEDACARNAWALLRAHADLCVQIAEVWECRARGDQKRAEALLERAQDWLNHTEPELHHALDAGLYESVLQRALQLR